MVVSEHLKCDLLKKLNAYAEGRSLNWESLVYYSQLAKEMLKSPKNIRKRATLFRTNHKMVEY